MNEDQQRMAAAIRAALASEGFCPECLGELDTGWECNKCGYDAMSEAQKVTR